LIFEISSKEEGADPTLVPFEMDFDFYALWREGPYFKYGKT
jgi:hypothetical protein